MGKVWALASGKGGTGKSTLAACLGIALGRAGKKVCVVDASTGLRGTDLLLGLENRVVFDMMDVADGTCTLEEAIVQHENVATLHLLSASQSAKAEEMTCKKIEKILKKLQKQFDVVLVDCPSGVESCVTDFVCASDACVLSVTPDDAAVRAVERLNTLLFEKGCKEVYLAVNFLREKWIQDGIMLQPAQVSNIIDAPLLGELPYSERVYQAFLQHKTPFEAGEKGFTDAIERMASRLLGQDVPFKTYRIRSKKWFRRVEG